VKTSLGKRQRPARSVAALVAVAGLLLVGCTPDPAGPGDPSSSPTTAPSSSAPPVTPSPSPSAASPSATPTPQNGPPSWGVDRVSWPTEIKAARTMLEKLPPTLGGESLDLDTGAKDRYRAEADYDSAGDIRIWTPAPIKDREEGEPEALNPNTLLAANFTLEYLCNDGTYQGTARSEEGLGPEPSEDNEPVWFSCAVEGLGGSKDDKGFALGWSEGKLAYLVFVPDRETLTPLLTALRAAAG